MIVHSESHGITMIFQDQMFRASQWSVVLIGKLVLCGILKSPNDSYLSFINNNCPLELDNRPVLMKNKLMDE